MGMSCEDIDEEMIGTWKTLVFTHSRVQATYREMEEM